MSQRKKDQLDPFAVQNPMDIPLFEFNPAIPLRFEPWPPTIEFVEAPKPLWLSVIERILVKAREHLKAGRGGDFSQVLVPMADYKALVEFFGEEDPLCWTPIGMVSIHPVNPDGATFVD